MAIMPEGPDGVDLREIQRDVIDINTMSGPTVLQKRQYVLTVAVDKEALYRNGANLLENARMMLVERMSAKMTKEGYPDGSYTIDIMEAANDPMMRTLRISARAIVDERLRVDAVLATRDLDMFEMRKAAADAAYRGVKGGAITGGDNAMVYVPDPETIKPPPDMTAPLVVKRTRMEVR